jgi:predicted secreted protein
MVALANFNCLAVCAWLVGLLVAFGRRKEHPQVSVAVLWSIACMFVAGCLSHSLRVGIWADSLPGAGTLALVGFANLLLFSMGWGAILAAAVGWREHSSTPEQPRVSLQFSIRELFLLTVIVAVLCGIMRLLVWGLALEPTHLPLLIGDMPFYLFWIVGAWMAWDRRGQSPGASSALAWGIGIQAGSILALVFFAVGARINSGRVDGPAGPLMALFSMFAIFLAFPLSWIFLLAAALGWRDQRQTRVAGTDSRVAADQVDNA